MTYAEKLQDPRWQKKRLEVLQRAGWKCQECGSPDRSLHVHHVNYRRETDPWDYEDGNFQVFCFGCHGLREEMLAHAVAAVRVCLKDVPNQRLKVVSEWLMGKAMEEL